MTRADIFARLKKQVEKRYNEGTVTEFDKIEATNFELMDDGAIRVYVRVSFLGAWTIFHGRINDTRDYGLDLTNEEREFLKETFAQAPARVAPPTRVSRYIMHLASQLKDVVGTGSELSSLTGALLSNPNLIGLITHVDVDLIIAYVERLFADLVRDYRSGMAVSGIALLLSNPNLRSIIDHQQVLDEKIEEAKDVTCRGR